MIEGGIEGGLEGRIEGGLEGVVDPARTLREIEPGLYSVLDADDEGAPYDGFAAAYDRAVSNGAYLRVAWGIARDDNARFVRSGFEETSEGWVLDVAAGSCVDSAAAYAATQRPTMVLDRSLAMLRRGMQRLRDVTPRIPPNVFFVQADATALPIVSKQIASIVCHGAYHVFPDPTPILREWRRVHDGTGSISVSSLVRGRWLGDRYLGLLARSGEIARPRTALEFRHALENGLEAGVACETIGNFAYARTARPEASNVRSTLQRSES